MRKGHTHTEKTIKKMSEIKKGNTYALGHTHSEESKRKMRKAQKGNTNALGHKHTEEAKKKMSKALKGKTPWLGKKHTAETKKKLSKSKKGKNHPNFGKHISKITRIKISDAHKGKIFTVEHKRNMSIARKGKHCPHKGVPHSEEWKRKIGKASKGRIETEETRKKKSVARLGKNNPMWKGGISILSRRIRTCFRYRQWRSDVFTRDNFMCQKCGESRGILDAHHVKKFSAIMAEYKIKTFEQALACEELWNINNGQTLCKDKCHKQAHMKQRGKAR